MPMNKYKRQRNAAKRMVRKFGENKECRINYPAERIGGPNHAPIYSDPEIVPAPAILLPRGGLTEETFRMDTLLPQTTHVIYLAGDDVPRDIVAGMQIETFEGLTNVLTRDVYQPSGIPILYVVQVRV